jgi:hypothetical protein
MVKRNRPRISSAAARVRRETKTTNVARFNGSMVWPPLYE